MGTPLIDSRNKHKGRGPAYSRAAAVLTDNCVKSLSLAAPLVGGYSPSTRPSGPHARDVVLY